MVGTLDSIYRFTDIQYTDCTLHIQFSSTLIMEVYRLPVGFEI